MRPSFRPSTGLGRGLASATLVAMVGLAGCASGPNAPVAPPASVLLQRSASALGTAGLKSLTVSGKGTGGAVGQAYLPGMAWPALNYSLLSRTMNFETGAFREELARSRGEPTGGGATPLMGQGEAKAIGFARDGFAWGPAANGGTPAPVALDGRIHDLWTGTPQGAILAAQRYGAVSGVRLVDGQPVYALAYTAPGQYAATLVLDDAGLVTRIESTVPNPVLGDMAVVTEFSDYRDMAGLRFPARIRQSQGGFATLDITVTEMQTNVPADILVPDNVKAARENVTVEKVADGVWFLAGGSHNSVAIELADQIVLVESPLYDGRAKAVLATANGLVTGKAVKTVVNTHHHFDHAGGLRTAAAAGVELITTAAALPWYERSFANLNRIAPDALALSGRKAKITGISGSTVLRDSSRPVEIHELQGSLHAQGFLMVWLPKEKLLIEADAYTPGPPNSPPPAVPNALQVNLADNLARLGIAPDRILPLHGRAVPASELYQQIGRKP
jgi:glyoxylase-like metal-dependent hydrolase (beta-lactamase superfamily II)